MQLQPFQNQTLPVARSQHQRVKPCHPTRVAVQLLRKLPGVRPDLRQKQGLLGRNPLQTRAASPRASPGSKQDEVLSQLRRVIDPDFGLDIVSCGFVKDLVIGGDGGRVSFKLELTTPACPVKEDFRVQATKAVQELPWVTEVDLTMTAQPAKSLRPDSGRPQGLKDVRHVIAVSSCKGGVGKSTVAVNLAFTLAQMGAKVGIFDADVYGPSLPQMISPENPIMQMDSQTNMIVPTEYLGVKAVSFGFAGQGSAIMRGPMVSSLIQQMLTTAMWGELDYLVVDFPPGTGDIQLTLCQSVAFSAAVIVTTPQKLAFIDVAKGIHMFAKLKVPCVAVVENMSYFEAEGKRYFPFGQGSGQQIQEDFGLPNLVQFPIVPNLSAAGDGGKPLVIDDPTCPTSATFMGLGALVVREVAKAKAAPLAQVSFLQEHGAITVRLPGSDEFWLKPSVVRRNDKSAASVDEWTGERTLRDEDIPEDIAPQAITPLGNYAALILWPGGFSQIAPYDQLASLRHLAMPRKETSVTASVGGQQAVADLEGI